MNEPAFVDPVPRGAAVVKAIWVWLAIEAIAGATAALALIQLAAHQPDEPMTDAITPVGAEIGITATTFAAIAQFLVFLVAGVMILRWIHRIVANAHAIADGLTISPGWAVGWYFVPVANLWKPFAAIREAWAVAVAPERWADIPAPALLRWWWGLWIATNIIDNLSFRLSLRPARSVKICRLPASIS